MESFTDFNSEPDWNLDPCWSDRPRNGTTQQFNTGKPSSSQDSVSVELITVIVVILVALRLADKWLRAIQYQRQI
jgi:hypothetical protein